MKKIFLIFSVLFLSNISIGWGAFFYADSIESVIQEYFPEDRWEDAAAEYMAQIDPTTGEIDSYGFMNFCYAGGIDVTTAQGAAMCGLIAKSASEACAYYRNWKNVYDKEGKVVSSDRNFLDFYDNAKPGIEKVRKCILDKTIDWAVDNYEGGLQHNIHDSGNKEWEWKNGQLVEKVDRDSKGNRIYNGATYRGITTGASQLSRACIDKMKPEDAYRYYWTRHYMVYRYYLLPIELQALVLEMSISGSGKAAETFMRALDGEPKSGWRNTSLWAMMVKAPLDALQNFIIGINTNSSVWKEYESALNSGQMGAVMNLASSSLDLFNYKYAKNATTYPDRRKHAYRELREIYKECAKEKGVSLEELGVKTKNNTNTSQVKKTNQSSEPFVNTQIKDDDGGELQAFVVATKQMFKEGLADGIGNSVHIKCEGQCSFVGQDYVRCTLNGAKTKTYEFDDICEGRVIKNRGVIIAEATINKSDINELNNKSFVVK